VLELLGNLLAHDLRRPPAGGLIVERKISFSIHETYFSENRIIRRRGRSVILLIYTIGLVFSFKAGFFSKPGFSYFHKTPAFLIFQSPCRLKSRGLWFF
jgi:hypothetical protein